MLIEQVRWRMDGARGAVGGLMSDVWGRVGDGSSRKRTTAVDAGGSVVERARLPRLKRRPVWDKAVRGLRKSEARGRLRHCLIGP
jgi:hypothetical protein